MALQVQIEGGVEEVVGGLFRRAVLVAAASNVALVDLQVM